MSLATAAPHPPADLAAIEAAVQAACARVAPLWQLHELVAVNPYLGHADTPLLAADARLHRCLGDGVLPAPEDLSAAWRAGRFGADDLVVAAGELGLDAAAVAAIRERLDADAPAAPAERVLILGVAARLSAAGHGPWPAWIAAHISAFLAARSDGGIARFPAAAGTSVWRDWLVHARHDRSLEALGLAGFAAFAAELPDDAAAARAALVLLLGVPAGSVEDYAVHLLGGIQGWAGAMRRSGWERNDLGAVADLLTVCLACEAALAMSHSHAPAALLKPLLPAAGRPSPPMALLPMRAAELGFRRRVLEPVAMAAAARQPMPRPAAHAVFCIDVRSEPLRRALESADPDIATAGFAGFFGVAAVIADGEGVRAQCPVLLTPGPHVPLAPARPKRWFGRLIGHLRRSAGGGFAYMETAGFLAAAPMIGEAFGLARAARPGDVDVCSHPEHDTALSLAHLPEEQLIGIARTILTHLHLEGVPGRLLLLCGHDSSSANNPQAAGLSCGACGGHGGASNARIAAAILNHAGVRRALGEALPADTVAMAGVHDTTTDRVRLLDAAAVPASHRADLARLESALSRACASAQARRAATLPGLDGGDPAAALARRARDWAETRPEWALAGCAAFIAAPRSATRGIDLGGRCFLHSYDEGRDAGHATLELILVAPVVVASWIALGYHGAVVAPKRWSSGSKTIHNPVGMAGILQGNQGDLAVGPAWQSIHDGDAIRHDPIRLAVVIHADPAAIDAILARHPGVGALFDNGWLTLHAIGDGGLRQRLAAGTWR